MSLIFKNLKRKLQGKPPIVNTTGQTREEIQEQENEEDQAPKAVSLDPKPKPKPKPKKKNRLKASAFLGSRQKGTSSLGPGSGVSGQQAQPHRSTSNPSGPVQSKTSYDKKALARLAEELSNEGRGIEPETLKQLQSREKEIASTIHGDIGFEKIAGADMVFVSVKGNGSLSGPPMVLKNRLTAQSGFRTGLAGSLLQTISENHDPVDIEIIRDPTRTIYLIYLGCGRDKEWDDMKAQQASRMEVEKYILVKGIPDCRAGRRKAAGYPSPVISILRGHAHNSPVGPADILAQAWTDKEDAILSIKIRKCDLPLPLTVEVNADHEGVMGQDLTFLRQGTFPGDDKVSRVVVDLNHKGSAGKQPAIDEEFVGQVNQAMDGWAGMEMEDVDLSEHSHSLSVSTSSPVFSSSMMPASAISSFPGAAAIPHTRSLPAHQALVPGATNWGPMIKEYADERALEISEAVVEQALTDQNGKIAALETKVKKLENDRKAQIVKKHKAKGSSYATRARGGTTTE